MKIKKYMTFRNTIVHTLILGMIASLSHFAYELSGENLLAGFFNPVNESVWEHLKFMFFPLLLWWVIRYQVSKNMELSMEQWVVSGGVSLCAAPLTVLLLFYTYTGALGFESVGIDIFLAFFGFYVALGMGNHILKFGKKNGKSAIVLLVIVIILFISFMVFTVATPKLPVFMDSVTGEYGRG